MIFHIAVSSYGAGHEFNFETGLISTGSLALTVITKQIFLPRFDTNGLVEMKASFIFALRFFAELCFPPLIPFFIHLLPK